MTLRPGQCINPNAVALSFIATNEIRIAAGFKGNPINVLAKILMWISAWANYIF